MLRRLVLALFLAVGHVASAQVELASSNLPIVVIETDGVQIPDEPKIPARMRIIDNGPGARNAVTDPPNDYDGHVGIELRGTSSLGFPKRQYGLETRDADGEDLDASLLGLPEEEDWVLSAPYSDKSLMRNVLAYHLARATGRYASRTRFCELVLNGAYVGVYVLTEKVKRDDNRVDISRLRPHETSGDDLTGGYIVQLDRPTEPGWFSAFPAAYPTSFEVFYQYDTPDGDDVAPEQEAYIQALIHEFERAMASEAPGDPATGYPAIIDVGSFEDHVLVNELAKNVDAYRLSTYLHKDKDSRDPLLHAGPVWDFNIAFGNAYYYGGGDEAGYVYDTITFDNTQPVPFWWERLAESEAFRSGLSARWRELRAGPFHTDSLLAFIDSTASRLEEAQTRNFRRWPVLGVEVWPNVFVGETYAEEVEYLKRWVRARALWLDGGLATSSGPGAQTADVAISVAPNPVRAHARVTVSVARTERVTVDLLDALGRRVAVLHDGPVAPGTDHALDLDASGLAGGVYVVRARGETFARAETITVVPR